MKRELLLAFLTNEDFLQGRGYVNLVRQFHFCVTTMYLLYSHTILFKYTKDFIRPLDFHEFLVDCHALQALMRIVEHKTPTLLPTDTEEVPWHWESVPGLALMSLQLFLHLHRYDNTKLSQSELARMDNIALKMIKVGMVPCMLQVLARQEVELVALSRCISQLKHLSFILKTARADMLKANGVEILIPYFAPGMLEGILKNYRKGKMSRATKLVLAQGVLCYEAKEMAELVEEDYHLRAARHVEAMHEIAGTLISWMAEISDSSREFVLAPGTQTCLTTAMRWLCRPLTNVEVERCLVKSAAELILVMMSGSHAIAHKFMDRFDMKDVLDRWLMSPVEWPIAELLNGVRKILEKQTVECHCYDHLTDYRELAEVCSLYLFTKAPSVQAMAYCIVIFLVQSSQVITKRLNRLEFLTPEMFKKISTFSELPRGVMDILAEKMQSWCGDHWRLKDKRIDTAHREIGGKATKGMHREEMKRLGNDAFHDDKLSLAIKWYTAALAAPGDYDQFCVTVLSNRAECYLRQGNYQKTVQDATRAICYDFHSKDQTLLKALFRRSKAFFHLGRLFEARNDIARCVEESDNERFAEFKAVVFQRWEEKRPDTDKLMAELTRDQHERGVCTNCGHNEGRMKQCARCITSYCSKQCQMQHWQLHKYVCGKEADSVGQPAAAAPTARKRKGRKERK